MSALALEPIDPLDAFRARCEARAILYGAGELALHDAVDVPQADAARDGLVKLIGQDAVQAVMAEAFRPIGMAELECERAEIAAASPEPKPEPETPRRSHTPGATIEALMYVLRGGLGCVDDLGNRDRLRCCDADAIRVIAARLLDMNAQSKGARPDWAGADVAKLISRWKTLRGHKP
jgi:hypothetical protein